MKKALLFTSLFLSALAGCQTMKPAPRKPDSIVCGDSNTTAPHLTWVPATDMPTRTAGGPLPQSYRAFLVAPSEAEAFFTAIRKKEELKAAIPLPVGCVTFDVKRSNTISDAMQEKYPNMVSAKGTSPAGHDLRLDWDGKSFSGQVIATGGATYFIQPRTANDKVWYVVYDKQSTQEVKQPFEQMNRTPAAER